jgi:PEP-CTERM motif-containing protein
MGGSALTASATGTTLLASQLFAASTPTTANQWQTETLSFTADSLSTTIEFLGDSTNVASRYIGLDDVSVSSSVPEASTWAMMLAGFASLGFVGYRRVARGRAAA